MGLRGRPGPTGEDGPEGAKVCYVLLYKDACSFKMWRKVKDQLLFLIGWTRMSGASWRERFKRSDWPQRTSW